MENMRLGWIVATMVGTKDRVFMTRKQALAYLDTYKAVIGPEKCRYKDAIGSPGDDIPCVDTTAVVFEWSGCLSLTGSNQQGFYIEYFLMAE